MLPAGLVSILDDALQVIEQKSTRVNEAGIRLAAKAGDPEANITVRQWNSEDGAATLVYNAHDGSELKTLSQVAIASGVTKAEAAHYIVDDQQASGLDPTLIAEAEAFLSNPSWGESACIMLIPENPESIAIIDGEPPEMIHLTMVYFTEMDCMRLSKETFFNFVESTTLYPIEAELNGQTVFYNDSKKHHVVLNVDSPAIEDFRAGLLHRLKDQQIEVTRTHGYTPHITIATIKPDDPVPQYNREAKSVRFTRLRASYGGTVRQYKIQGWDQKSARYVRTPAGMRHYGLPIGARIVRDVLPNLDRIKKTNDARSFLTGKADVARYEQNGIRAELRRNWRGVILYLTDQDRGGRRIKDVYLRDANNPSAVEKLIRDHMKDAEKERVPMVAHEQSAMRDSTEGIYGYDWAFADEEGSDGTEESRREYAAWDSEDLGLVIENTRSTVHGDELELHIDAHEMVNLAMRAYSSFWPNITSVMGKVRITDEALGGRRNYYGFNSVDVQPGSYGLLGMFMAGTVGGDVISLSDSHFGTTGNGDMGRSTPEEVRVGFKVGNVAQISEDFGITVEQASMLRTFNHEFGHSVVRRLYNEREEKAANEIRTGFFNELDELLQTYGLSRGHMVQVTNEWKRFAETHVSGYAATNHHEFMAEVWASYMLDRKQTEVVAMVGNLMDYWFNEYMNLEEED